MFCVTITVTKHTHLLRYSPFQNEIQDTEDENEWGNWNFAAHCDDVLTQEKSWVKLSSVGHLYFLDYVILYNWEYYTSDYRWLDIN